MPDTRPQISGGAEYFCARAHAQGFTAAHRGLVVGCGEGVEAAFIAAQLDAAVTGCEFSPRLTRRGTDTPRLHLLRGDAMRLPVKDASADFIFYHHVIEHVADPVASLREIKRVLAPGGVLFLGTPNRHRVAGYMSSPGVSLRQKVAWNTRDYYARMRGRFTNAEGAHAGFTQKELDAMLEDAGFSVREWVTDDYLKFKYGGRMTRHLVNRLSYAPVLRFAAPSLYAFARA